MPNVEDARISGASDFYVRPNVLAVQHHIFSAPSKRINFNRKALLRHNTKKAIKTITQQSPRRILGL
jgi:hypothetical protein